MKRLRGIDPLILFSAVVIVLIIVGKLIGTPVGALLMSAYKGLGAYSYPLIFLAAFLEGLFVINMYVPGSSVVILGAVASRAGTLNIWLVIAVAWMGSLSGYSFCYFLGLRGWYTMLKHIGARNAVERMRSRMLSVGARVICVANIHPNIGAVASIVSGVIRIPFARFILLSGVSALFWNVFWGTIAYSLGDSALRLFNGWLLIPVFVVVVLLAVLGRKTESQSTS